MSCFTIASPSFLSRHRGLDGLGLASRTPLCRVQKPRWPLGTLNAWSRNPSNSLPKPSVVIWRSVIVQVSNYWGRLQIVLGMEMRLAIKDVGEGHVVSSPGSNIHCWYFEFFDLRKNHGNVRFLTQHDLITLFTFVFYKYISIQFFYPLYEDAIHSKHVNSVTSYRSF